MSEMSFGSKLRQLREEKRISVRQLAKRVGVSSPFLSDIELGRRFPAPEKIEALAKELEVDVDELKKFDFRDEAETIRKMMFQDAETGMAFRSALKLSPEELKRKLLDGNG